MDSESTGSGYKPSRFRSFRIRVFGFFRAWALRIVCATWLKDINGLDILDQKLAKGEHLIAVLWHGKYATLLPMLCNRNAHVFTSLSPRGDVIANLLTHFGFVAVQIPDHGRDRSLDIMRKTLASGDAAVIAVDGPLGPYHVVHRGAVQLASELGWLLIPISVAASRKRILAKRWDKLEMPQIFARVCLVIGDPIRVPPNLDQKALETWISRVKFALEAVDLQASSILSQKSGIL